MIRQAYILAGGFGTRLGKLTKTTPKPMLHVNDRPFIEYILKELKRFGVERIVLGTGYLAEVFESYFKDGSKLGLKIIYSVEDVPLGTGGAVKAASDLLDDVFYVINGDSLADFDYTLFAPFEKKTDACCLAVREVKNAKRYGAIDLDDDKIIGFSEKSRESGGVINAGIYLLKKQALELLPSGPCSIEKELFPHLITKGKLFARKCEDFFIDIGIQEAYTLASEVVPNFFCRKAVFLDRDGVLNYDEFGYLHKISDFRWMDGATDAIKLLNSKGYYVFCITNQSGIGRGYYTEQDYFNLTRHMQESLFSGGAHIDAFYHCPHTPDSNCTCRKPKIGLFEKALSEWSIVREGSFLIGDKDIDIQAAINAGFPGYQFSGGNLKKYIEEVLDIEQDK